MQDKMITIRLCRGVSRVEMTIDPHESTDDCFDLDRSRPDGLRLQCKACRAAELGIPTIRRRRFFLHLLADLGVLATRAEFEKRIIEQCGRCEICSRIFNTTALEPCWDHNHVDGTLRGLLCQDCNRALGGFRDSASLCSKGAEYLIKYQAV